MASTRRIMIVTLALCVARTLGQTSTNQPHIGYLYPAGGQQGSTIKIIAGGQFLNGATDVYVSGEGVHASVVKYIRPLRNIQQEQRKLLQQRLKEVREKRLAELTPKGRRSSLASQKRTARKTSTAQKAAAAGASAKTQASPSKQEAANTQEVKLPDHPLLYDLDDKSLRELAHITSILFFPRNKVQTNRQLAEMVLIEVKIDPDAQPGNRELRLAARNTLTNPVVFQVGTLPEIRELEPNNKEAYPALPSIPKSPSIPKDKPLDLPVILNGQILPGDIDRFRFTAKQGQQLVIEAQARSLIPYLADAVPGWFQATLALYDDRGKEVAFADDYRFNPDPVLLYRISKSGEYELEIRDSIYRGREDFVYRISVGETPFITQMFPLGGKAGVRTAASIAGWNLSEDKLPLDTPADGVCIRQAAYYDEKNMSNPVPYAVDTLPECNDAESNDTIENAQRIDLPKIINGRIDKPGDIDIFRFNGSKGDKIVAEVFGRRLNSPLDSLLRLTDSSGNILEWNDDYVLVDSYLHKDLTGLVTHHADSYLYSELPKNGTYYVHLSDSQRHGGQAYGYRLRIADARGDFALFTTPSSFSVRAGGIIPIQVHALRKDKYDGEIEVLLRDAPGFELNGGRIPAGRDSVRMTLKVPPKAPDQPVVLKMEGRARIAGQTVSHPVIPTEDMMQAFLYRHLVPAQELFVVVQEARWGAPPVELAGESPVRIPLGGTARVLLKTRKSQVLNQMQLELNKPPDGITLQGLKVVPQGLEFRLKADKNKIKSTFSDNLIVEAFRRYTPKQKNGKPSNQKRRYSMGILPAIPIEIVQQ